METRPLIRLAIPGKGRIAAPVQDLIEKSGLHVLGEPGRRLIAKTLDPSVEILFARPVDIPRFVENGAADLGITGRDMVMEQGSEVEELLDLGIGTARLVLAVPEDSPIRSAADCDGRLVATEFPKVSGSFFSERGVGVEIVSVGGACEAAPQLGIADAVIDLTSSGITLKTNRLRIVEEVLTTSTRLIANHESLPAKREKIDEIVLALESVVRAKGQCYLMMNVHRTALDAVTSKLPGLSGPTVMDVASHEGLVAVHAVVSEERVYRLISQLKQAGARDILVMPIERMIR